MFEILVKVLALWTLFSFVLFGSWMWIRSHYIRKARRDMVNKAKDDKIFEGAYAHFHGFEQ